ncbi:hypothetical protein [Streptomyces sp. CT34]|uniref:hypothetical protein n=1 Tax=Streptomyces sp. CT34 TaxID=1553907 RepID=UPI00068C56B3|nr:hypothetical protein [Streptomyces sp. CT34]
MGGKLTVHQDDGPRRHREVKLPKSSAYWFEVIAWPGALAISWHSSTHVFRHTDDLFATRTT